jgi:hypothetical protein
MTKICIVGGGSAGWITLSYIVATIDADITIIHSDDIDQVGIGESTAPTIKHIADTIGIDERVWMKDAQATFKYGVEFCDFNNIGSRWLHTFDDMIPHQCFNTLLTNNGKVTYKKDLTSVDYFLKSHCTGIDMFNNTHGPQAHMVEEEVSPYSNAGDLCISQYPGYSYHINALKFGASLKRFTCREKYREIRGSVIETLRDEHRTTGVVLSDGRTIEADIFFDCTGFRRELIKDHSTWDEYGDLINDRAVWGTIPTQEHQPPVTRAHAMDSGWIWTIPTYGQIGTGYVYSSHHCSDSEAQDTLTDYWRCRGYDCNLMKQIKFTAGVNSRVSAGNVISNGLAQSFIEPLEATSVMITCATVKNFVELYNRHKFDINKTTRIHDRVMRKFIEHTKRFVRMHYALSDRCDTQYWRIMGRGKDAVSDTCDYIDILSRGTWVNKGETLLNQWNWTSMLLGYNKRYINDLPEISNQQIDNYHHYTKLLIDNYKHMLRSNMPIGDYLDLINNHEN